LRRRAGAFLEFEVSQIGRAPEVDCSACSSALAWIERSVVLSFPTVVSAREVHMPWKIQHSGCYDVERHDAAVFKFSSKDLITTSRFRQRYFEGQIPTEHQALGASNAGPAQKKAAKARGTRVLETPNQGNLTSLWDKFFSVSGPLSSRSPTALDQVVIDYLTDRLSFPSSSCGSRCALDQIVHDYLTRHLTQQALHKGAGPVKEYEESNGVYTLGLFSLSATN